MPSDEHVLDRGWEITDPQHLTLYKRAEPKLKTRLNTLHTRIAYHFAVRLLKEVGGDPEVVIPAILLHDIGWSAIPEDQLDGAFGPTITKPDLHRLHETEGARMAAEILEEMACPGQRIQEIREIISGHDTRLVSLGLNDAVVKDADKLFRYTYEGFTLDYKRFRKTPRENLLWLIESIPKWFFNEISTALAYQEALKRGKEYAIVLDGCRDLPAIFQAE